MRTPPLALSVPHRLEETTQALQSFELMVGSVKDSALIRLDAEGWIRTSNARARAIEGYEADEAIGKPIASIRKIRS